MLTVSSIAHVAIRVKDVSRTLDFYVTEFTGRIRRVIWRDPSR